MSKLFIENVLITRNNKSVIFTDARIKREKEEKIKDFIFIISTNYINNLLSIYLYSFSAFIMHSAITQHFTSTLQTSSLEHAVQKREAAVRHQHMHAKNAHYSSTVYCSKQDCT